MSRHIRHAIGALRKMQAGCNSTVSGAKCNNGLSLQGQSISERLHPPRNLMFVAGVVLRGIIRACTSQAESHNCELIRCSCKRHDGPVKAAVARRINRQRFCFNPRPSREGRLPALRAFRPAAHRVSIHAPRMRGDVALLLNGVNIPVSIHAPRMRGDLSFGIAVNDRRKF